MKYSNNQQGFTLVTVMILTSIAGVLVLNSLKDNVNQERLSGNFQKSINARLASERGLYESIEAAKTALLNDSDMTIQELITELGTITGTQELTHDGITYTVEMSEEGDELVLESVGKRYEGEETLKARLKIGSGGGTSGFTDAIVGCEGVNLQGSGAIDSYHSDNGNYSAGISESEGDVTTIDHLGADVILGGNTPIHGDINATGIIDVDNSSVDGNLHANGDITIGWGSNSFPVDGYTDSNNAQAMAQVTGNIYTRGDYTQNGNLIGGHVRANGNANMSWSSNILNLPEDGLDILYGGLPADSNFPDSGSHSGYPDSNNSAYNGLEYNVSPNVVSVKSDDVNVAGYDPTDPSTNCDYLDIADTVSVVDDGASSLDNFISSGSGVTYTLTPDAFAGSPDAAGFTAEDVDFLGRTTKVIKFGAFHLKGSDIINVTGGDVALFVEGDIFGNGNNTEEIGYKMDGATKLNIVSGSSLTIITKSKVGLTNGADIYAAKHGLANPPLSLPALSIYSSHDSDDDGIEISGDFETYAVIHAPLTNVDIAGSGLLFGAIRAKSVAITGGAAVHYDAALGESTQGGGGGSSSSTLSFVGFEYN